MQIHFYLMSICSLLFVIISLLLLGFAIAYILAPNIVSLVTQFIMIGGLLFSPIIYSADRLPSWMASIYNILPFVPVSNIIRASLFHLTAYKITDYIVVMAWGVASFLAIMYVLKKRE